MVKFLIGGSPCTHWSIAQSKARETEPDGIGWELFKNYLIAKEKFQPDFFLYENNKSAAEAIKSRISEELRTPLQYINSALVSAQNRWRFYAHNIPSVEQPEDRNIVLADILESVTGGVPIPVNIAKNGKAQCLRATCYKDGMLVNFKSRLMAIPSKLAPVLCKKTDKAEIFALLKDHIDEALMELSDFKTTFGERAKDEESDG